jgi:hypothetical protein
LDFIFSRRPSTPPWPSWTGSSCRSRWAPSAETSKVEEIYAPEVVDFVYITDTAYNVKGIFRMEI